MRVIERTRISSGGCNCWADGSNRKIVLYTGSGFRTGAALAAAAAAPGVPRENTCQEGNGPMSDLFHFVGQVNIKVRMLSSGQPPLFNSHWSAAHLPEFKKKKVQHSTTTSDPPSPKNRSPHGSPAVVPSSEARQFLFKSTPSVFWFWKRTLW